MARITIAAVKAELHRRITELLAGEPIQVLYGDRADRRRTSVWLGATDMSEAAPTAFRAGTVRRQETYTVEVHIEVVGTHPQETEARAIDLTGRIEEMLARDPVLAHAVPGVKSVVMAALRSNTNETGEGPICHVELQLRVMASLP
ncbi:hypothetical protein [Crossiella sp. NPDC003009]